MDQQSQLHQDQPLNRDTLQHQGGYPVAVPQNQPIVAQAQTVSRQSSDSSDTGLSEQDRQYIDKAIAAVEGNAGDPYTQNKAVNEIRAEYLKERFDKQINSDA